VIEAPVSLVSLTPTILDAAGVDYAADSFQEPSVYPHLIDTAEAPSEPVYVELDFERGVDQAVLEAKGSLRKAAIVSGRRKLIFDEQTETYTLFDLERDPGETRDLSAEDPVDFERLRSLLRDRMQTVRAVSLSAEVRELSAEERDRLEALGYLEAPRTELVE